VSAKPEFKPQSHQKKKKKKKKELLEHVLGVLLITKLTSQEILKKAGLHHEATFLWYKINSI
jgi:hypothetical protein